MGRVTASLSDAQHEWIDAESEERGVSKSQIIRDLIDGKRTDDVNSDADTHHSREVHQIEGRVDELENVVGEIAERVEGIERELAGDVEPSHQATEEDVATDGAQDLDASIDDAITDALEGWRPGRSIDEREARRESGRAAIEWLHEIGTASAGEFKREAYPEIGLETQSADTWWRKTARPALQKAQDAGLVKYERNVGYEWVGSR